MADTISTLILNSKKNKETGIIILVLFFSQYLPAQSFKWQFQEDFQMPDFGRIHLALPGEWMQRTGDLDPSEFMSVYVGEHIPESSDFPSIVGSYAWQVNGVTFRPKYLPSEGIKYTAVFQLANFLEMIGIQDIPTKQLIKTFKLEESREEGQTQVLEIYPTSGVVPANILRFYVEFSDPMQTQVTGSKIILLNTEGEILPDSFVEIETGLWDSERKRLTVIIHPGRVKTNVGLNLTMGSVLQEGSCYQLLVKHTFKDASGKELRSDGRKDFCASEKDQIQVDPTRWSMDRPTSMTRQKLNIWFDEALDYGLLQRMITITNREGSLVEGHLTILDEERGLAFEPETQWLSGSYSLLVNKRLEDLAGNNLNGLFERKVTGPAFTEEVSRFTTIEFNID